MKQHRVGTIWFVVLAAAVITGISYYDGAAREKREKEPLLYSIVLYQNTDNEWDALMDGMEQAKKDYHVKIRYMNLAENDTAREQAETMEREVEAGAQGIVYAAVDSDGLKEILDTMDLGVPMVSVETKGGNAVNISGDNYRMGQLLGEKILEDIEADGGKKCVTVISEYMQRDSVRERYRGLCDALEQSGENIGIQKIQRRKGDFSLSLFIGTSFGNSGDYIAALDKFSTQEAAKAWASKRRLYEENGKGIHVYGIGNTAQTVSDLDNGNLRALVFQNEFNMGYAAVRALADKEKKGYITDDFDIGIRLVTKETLYEPENERLLFPNS